MVVHVACERKKKVVAIGSKWRKAITVLRREENLLLVIDGELKEVGDGVKNGEKETMLLLSLLVYTNGRY